jgi:hypothetical protein
MAGGAVGTVRGRYELDAPALRTLRDLEKQGIRTQAQMRAVGEALDEIGGVKQAQELRDFNQAQADLRRGAERMGRTMRDEWVATTRVVRLEVRRQLTEIAKLEAALDRIGGRDATARISVRGATTAKIAKVEALGSALDRVDRGSIGSTVARTAPRPPRSGSFGGGGGGSGPFRPGGGGGGLLDLGKAGIRPRNLALGGALAYARPLLGAATAVAGSGAYALGGAGALGLAGGAALAAGVGGSLLTGKVAFGQIGAASKAMDKYTAAVADFGRASNQARMAKLNLDQAMASAPKGTRQLLRDVKDLRSEFTKMTRPGTNAMMQLFVGGVQAGRRLLRNGGASAINRVSRATSDQGQRFTSFLSGSTGQRALGLGSRIYGENLGYARQTGQYGIEAAVNVVQAARPMFEEMMRGIRDWTRGWSTSTRDISAVRRVIREMTDNLKSWWNLTRSAGGLVGALFGTSQGNGKKMVDDLTGQLREWTDWLKMNPSRVRDFFTSSTSSAEKLAGAIGHIAGSLWQIMGVVTPLLDRFAQLAGLAGSLGLATPGVGAAAFGAYSALSGRGKGRGGGGGGAGGGFVPIVTGGLGVRGAAAATRGTASETYALARSFGYGRAASATAATGALAIGAGSAASRIGSVALRGAGKAALPIALTMAALDYASFNGTPAQRVQAAASGGTLSLIPRPISASERADRGTNAANRFLSGLGTSTHIGNQLRAITAIRGRIGANNSLLTRGRYQSNTVVGAEGAGATFRIPGAPPGEFHRIGGGESAELRSQNKNLQSALNERVGIYRKYRAERDRALNASSRSRAQSAAGDYASGFKRRSRRVGAVNAFGQIVTDVLGDTGAHSGRRMAGRRELAQQTLDWAHAQAEANPALWKQYDRLVKGIEHRFDALKGHVQVVNGQILDGSTKQWNSLADSISSAARRGVSETSKEWQRLKALALGELTAMGYTKSEAADIFGSKSLRSQAATKTGSGQPLLQSESNKAKAHGLRGIGDGWGRSIGGGRRPIGDGAGNASAGNRSGGNMGTSAGQGGALMGANPALGGYASIGRSMGLSVTSGRRPGAITSAGNVSYHSSGNAIDMSGSPAAMRRFALYMAQHYGNQLEELIYSPLGWSIKNGQRTAPYAVAEHYNHVHVADTNPGAGGGAAGGLGGGVNPVSARASVLGGVTGALADAASQGMASAINQRLVGAGGVGGATSGGLGGGAVGSLGAGGAYTLSQLANLWTSAGGPPNIATLMAHVAMAESGGRPGARNPSGATGLWQILGNPFGGNALDPYTNARMAVWKYQHQGLGAWAASRGGWGKFAGAQGDGPGRSGTPGRRISSAPRRNLSTMRRPATAGRGAVNVHFHGDIHVRSDADIHAIADAVGEKILAALGGTTK